MIRQRRSGLHLIASMAAMVLSAPVAQAQTVTFTVNGIVSAPGKGGFTTGQAISLSATLNSSATSNVDKSLPGANAPYWVQNFPPQSHLWSAVSGTGMTGAWAFPVGHFAQSYLGTSTTDPLGPGWTGDGFRMFGNNIDLTLTSGLFVNSFEVIGFDAGANFLGLSARTSYGLANFFSPTGPDATDMFGSMVGTYNVDPNLSAFGRLDIRNIFFETVVFVPTQLIISTTSAVPEPGTLALLVGGLGMLGVAARRRPRQ